MKTSLIIVIVLALLAAGLSLFSGNSPAPRQEPVNKTANPVTTSLRESSDNKAKQNAPAKLTKAIKATKAVKKRTPPAEQPPKLSLHSVYLDNKHSLAFIRINNTNQRAYYAKQEITDGYVLQTIAADHVRVGKGDVTLVLHLEIDSEQLALSTTPMPAAPTIYELEEATGTQQPPNPNIKKLQANHFEVNRKFLIEELGNLDTYKSTHIAEDPEGFFVERIYDDSPFKQIGIRPGDVIHKINDKPVKNIFDLLSFYEKLDTLDRVEVLITRKMETQLIYYDLN